MFSTNGVHNVHGVLVVVLCLLGLTHEQGAAEKPDVDSILSEQKPFRMGRINGVWEKAKKSLHKEKLRALYSELKQQDVEELTLKRLVADGKDKDGLRSAAVAEKLNDLMHRYGLFQGAESGPPSATQERVKDRNIFKDDKLNKLWLKAAEHGKFGQDELALLHEEFEHQQTKLDLYHSLLDGNSQAVDDQAFQELLENDVFMADYGPKDTEAKENLIKQTRESLKGGYHRLTQLAAGEGPMTEQEGGEEFTESKVAMLWNLAKTANFDPTELHSLKEELLHYQSRLGKLSYLESQADHEKLDPQEKHYSIVDVDDAIQKKTKEVEKLHSTLEDRILRRIELSAQFRPYLNARAVST